MVSEEGRATLAAVYDQANLHEALRFVLQDKEDEELRSPVRDLPYLLNAPKKLAELSARLASGSYQPRAPVVLELAKSNMTTRPITYVCMDDWVVAQAILNQVAPVIDGAISPTTYSYRVNPARHKKKSNKFFKAWYRDWPRFLRSIRSAIGDACPCLLTTDIVGFFENVDLATLKQMILNLQIDPEVVDLLCIQLEAWVWRDRYSLLRHRGIPQGLDYSGLLASFYLSDIDRCLADRGVMCQRWLDDINIHLPDKSEAKRLLQELNRQLRKKGLTLNASKTHILEGDGIEEEFMFGLADQVDSLLKKNQRTVEASQSRESLRRELESKGAVDHYLFKRIITAYTRARDGSFLPRAIELLESHPGLTKKLCAYLTSVQSGDTVAAACLDFLEDNARNVFSSQEQTLLDTLMLVDIADQSLCNRLVGLADRRLHDPAIDDYSRALYGLAVFKYGEREHLGKAVRLYLSNKDKHPLLKAYLALCVTRLTERQTFLRVVDSLKREPNPDLTDLGIFLEEQESTSSAKAALDKIRLITLFFGPDWVKRLDPRDLILANVLRWNETASVRSALSSKIQSLGSALDCHRCSALLREIQSRL